MHALQTLQIVFSETRENSCPTIFSPLSNFFLLRTILHSNGLPLPLKVPLSLFSALSCPPLPPFQPDSSNIDPSHSGSDFSIFSSLPCPPPLCYWSFLHFFNGSSWHFLLFVSFSFSPCNFRLFTTSSGTFCMTSNFKELPSILLLSIKSSQRCSSFHCPAIWSPSCQLSSSSFSICEPSHLCMGFCLSNAIL